jgi:hypothetical protein
MRWLLLALAALGPLAALSCRYDPVPQEIIEDLGPELGKADSKHRPGQPCLACHSKYAGASPQMVFGGTVYVMNADKSISPAPGVSITVADSIGGTRLGCTNEIGNFFLDKAQWKEVAFPLTVVAGSRGMRSLIGRDGSCSSCHKPADLDHIERDPVTGASFDSAGVVLVEPMDLGQCTSLQ